LPRSRHLVPSLRGTPRWSRTRSWSVRRVARGSCSLIDPHQIQSNLRLLRKFGRNCCELRPQVPIVWACLRAKPLCPRPNPLCAIGSRAVGTRVFVSELCATTITNLPRGRTLVLSPRWGSLLQTAHPTLIEVATVH